MRATLERSGRTYSEAAPWDLDAWSGIVFPLTGQARDAFRRYGARLIEQRTLAESDFLALACFCIAVPHLRRMAKTGDSTAATEIKESMRDLGILDPDRIEPFRGARPVLADVLPFRRSEEPEHPPAA